MNQYQSKHIEVAYFVLWVFGYSAQRLIIGEPVHVMPAPGLFRGTTELSDDVVQDTV